MLRRISERFGALLIFDEIFTGLGRTGRLTFAEEVPCDLLCLGKALGGGLPLSACVGTERSMLAWPESSGEALHTGTFFGHALACEVAADTLRDIVDHGLPKRADELGTWCRSWLQSRLAHHPGVKEIRGIGLMLAIDFKVPGLGATLMDRLRGMGVISLASGSQGESLSLTPPLNIPKELLEEALQRIVGCLSEKPFVP
jgi:4-aminobutyrate aminotransferase/(S)-3-amino-2-methylpropionate transaminase